jgi:hypothetical protein
MGPTVFKKLPLSVLRNKSRVHKFLSSSTFSMQVRRCITDNLYLHIKTNLGSPVPKILIKSYTHINVQLLTKLEL